jgi:hypothetical protein
VRFISLTSGFVSVLRGYPGAVRHADPHPAVEQMKLTDVLAALSDPIRVDWSGCWPTASNGAGASCAHRWPNLRSATTSRRCGPPASPAPARRAPAVFVRLRRDDLDSRFPGLVEAVLEAAQAEDVGNKVSLVET